MSNQNESISHLFQTEFSKMIAVISRRFGLQHLEIAEDIVSETFLEATENGKKKGPHPTRQLGFMLLPGKKHFIISEGIKSMMTR